jgi:hypothetical protein
MPSRLVLLVATLLTVFAPRIVTTARACDAADCDAAKQTCQSAETQAPAQPQAAAGMRVAIDPKTGEYTDAPVLPSQATANMVAPAAPPVVEALPGGGYKIDTSNIRHAFVATANPGGLPQVNCIDQKPAPEN